MPTVLSVGDISEILRLGSKFTIAQATATIAAAQSLGAAPTSPATTAPHVQVDLTVPASQLIMTERFNWGRTSGTGEGGATTVDSVYYELYLAGRPKSPEGRTLVDFFGQEVGFYCSATVRPSCVDNHCTHILAAESITAKLWNITSPAAAVDIDFTLWYILLKEQELEAIRAYFDHTKAIKQAVNTLTQEIRLLRQGAKA